MLAAIDISKYQHNRECEIVTLAQSNYDPTRTTGLRASFARAMKKRFRKIRGLVRKAIVWQDCFGLTRQARPTLFEALPGRAAFDFPRSQDKITGFMEWFNKQVEHEILEVYPGQQLGSAIENAWTNIYVQSAYQKGIQRARAELRKAGYNVPTIENTGGIDAVFNQPIHLDRVGVLYTRVFNDLKGITATMDMQVSRVLAQGIADGKNPVQLARLLNKTISGPVGGLGITDVLGRFIPAERRAVMLARTEIIRAHHQATIQEYRNWEIEGVTVKAEWSTAGFGVCPICVRNEGREFTLDEVEGMIPVHPNCRCTTIPKEVK